MRLRTNDKRERAEVFTASMNDIMFFLMLFFIILSTLFNTGIIKVELPQSATAASSTAQQVVITINNANILFLDDVEMNHTQLKEQLPSLVNNSATPTVIVKCDKSIPVQELIKVLEIGTELDIKMLLATQK